MRLGLATPAAACIALAYTADFRIHAPSSPHASECAFDDVAFSASFAGGRLDGCRQTGTHSYTLTIEPEAQPINPSPWYAFDVESDTAQAIEITLDYGDFRHRYAPQVRVGSEWRPLGSPVVTGEAGTRATFTLEAPAGTSRVAAQELVTPEHARTWIRRLANNTSFQWGVLGLSAERRPIAYVAGGNARSGTLVVTGRQHPPEVAGSFALRAFVERLAGDDPLAVRFREEYRVFVVPMLNPDGVARGHWRLDSAGTDLNRDWGPFTRPETRLVRAWLRKVDPVLIIDFHATKRDVLYTPPDDADIARAWLAPAWHAAINARLDGPPLARHAAHNPENPTLKSWAPTALGVPAVTFEVGDATARERVEVMGRIAAEEAMRLLLSDNR